MRVQQAITAILRVREIVYSYDEEADNYQLKHVQGEVKNWSWKFGRGMPRKISVAKAESMREKMQSPARQRTWTTRKRNAEMRDRDS